MAGEEHSYSAFGYGVLTQALSLHTGHSFGEMLRIHITDPLGMRDTVLKPNFEQRRWLAAGYDHRTHRTWTKVLSKVPDPCSRPSPDMLFYVKANMGKLDTPLYSDEADAPRARPG